MKKKWFVSALLVVLCMMGCTPQETEVDTTITLSESILSMTVGDIAMLEATVSPVNADVVWTSSDDSVATVFHGAVTAMGIGHATITATANGTSAACVVYSVGASGQTLSLTPYLVEMNKGETRQLKYTDVYGVPLTWASDAEDIVSVTQTGVATAHASGNARITLTNGAETVECLVAVAHEYGEYTMVWSEEFNGTALDQNVWNIEVNGSGGGNNEKQYYTARTENLRVQNGCLEIEARKEAYTKGDRTWDYTSGRINSKGKKFFRYGKVEARIWLPSGGGTWPAFWMMGNDFDQRGWPRCGEIDIMEHVGNNPGMVSFALHTVEKSGMNGRNWHAQKRMDGIENNWHTYGIIWEKEVDRGCDRIIFTVDGEECASSTEGLTTLDDNAHWPFNKEHFIILNLAIGGNMGGQIKDDCFDHDVIMKVDWVRVWQRNNE